MKHLQKKKRKRICLKRLRFRSMVSPNPVNHLWLLRRYIGFGKFKIFSFSFVETICLLFTWQLNIVQCKRSSFEACVYVVSVMVISYLVIMKLCVCVHEHVWLFDMKKRLGRAKLLTDCLVIDLIYLFIF